MPKFVCCLAMLPKDCINDARIASLGELRVYDPESVTFICSQEKMRWTICVGHSATFVPGTPDDVASEIDSDLYGESWEDDYLSKSDADKMQSVTDEFADLDEAVEFWRGNPPF